MSYSGDDEGLDLSWSSDLKDAQAQRNGTTVGGTTEDDYGDEQTQALPSDVDPDELTATQREIVTTAAIHPKASQSDIADQVGCTRVYVGDTLEEHYSNHPGARVRGGDGRNQWEECESVEMSTEGITSSDGQEPTATVTDEAERIKQARIAITAIQRSAGPQIEDALEYVVEILDGDEQ